MHLLSLLFTALVFTFGPVDPIQPLAPVSEAPVLQNPGFECGDGYHDEPGIHGMVANGWTGKILNGTPFMASTQMWAKYSCDPNDMSWEKLEGHDSNIFMGAWAPYGEGFESPPFDVALYQPVDVSAGTEYSLSAWMTSLCGGSAMPNTCPAGAYIAKMAGLDPTGGANPLGATVQWTENRRPHIEVPWANLSVATTAQTNKLTVFVRINSPFLHHENTAFADAVKLVRAPTSYFTSVRSVCNGIAVSWNGNLGPDIPAIPETNHKLSFELQVRKGGDDWQPWLSGQAAASAIFTPPAQNWGQTHQFRIRAWGIQPDGQPGAWPNHHFVGVWHESNTIQTGACPIRAYLPLTLR